MSRKKPLPAVIDHAEAAAGLTEKQLAFVKEVAQGAGKTQAAITAGYAEASAAAEAWRLCRNPLIMQEINRLSIERFAERAPAMMSVVEELALTAKSGMVRLMAAQDWLDRAGYKPIERHQHAIAGDLKVSIDLS
jgi:hypothetical protein